MKTVITILVLFALLGAAIWYRVWRQEAAVSKVDSFESCAKAGYPVTESNPRQCRTADGRVFAEEIAIKPTYKNASDDLIKVELPYPGAVVGKSFSVIGQARGQWFFEASFPVEVVDPNGNRLAAVPAQAQPDPKTGETNWMTTEFVPFKANITVPQSYIGPATLILHNDNPSGDPSREKSISFPITIEY